jgi:hypothetical protein
MCWIFAFTGMPQRIGWAPTTSLRISRGSNAGLDTGEFTTDAAHNVVNHGVRLTAGTFTLFEILFLLRLSDQGVQKRKC